MWQIDIWISGAKVWSRMAMARDEETAEEIVAAFKAKDVRRSSYRESYRILSPKKPKCANIGADYRREVYRKEQLNEEDKTLSFEDRMARDDH